VTAKAGLPAGPLWQELTLQTNLGPAPTRTLTIEGTVKSYISLVGRGWNPDHEILTVGAIPRQTGMKRTLLLVVRGPHRKETTFKVASVTPSALKVTLGEPKEISDGP